MFYLLKIFGIIEYILCLYALNIFYNLMIVLLF